VFQSGASAQASALSRAPVLMAVNQLLKRMNNFYRPLQSGNLLLCAKHLL
jgi:hypothetical protein